MGECSSKNECCCSCHEQKNESCCPAESGEGMGEWFLEVADEAWTEVLKEKIKEHIKATAGDRMNELAKIVSEGNNQRWKLKMEKKSAIGDFADKLCSFFSQHKK